MIAVSLTDDQLPPGSSARVVGVQFQTDRFDLSHEVAILADTVTVVRPLYVTGFVVTPAKTPSGGRSHARLVDHAADWLSRGGRVIHGNGLVTDGHETLSEGHDGESRDALWTVIEARATRVLLIGVAQKLAQNVMLTTRITIGDLDAVTSFRVGIARESDGGGALTPCSARSSPNPQAIVNVRVGSSIATCGRDMGQGGRAVGQPSYAPVMSRLKVRSASGLRFR